VDDLHRVFALQVGLGLFSFGVEPVGPEVGRDVTVQEIELKVNEDRLVIGYLETEPVEPRLTFAGVVEVVDVIGGAVDIASEPEKVGLPPGVVGLGLNGGSVRGGECECPPLDSDC
jgi:hypothetical protein